MGSLVADRRPLRQDVERPGIHPPGDRCKDRPLPGAALHQAGRFSFERAARLVRGGERPPCGLRLLAGRGFVRARVATGGEPRLDHHARIGGDSVREALCDCSLGRGDAVPSFHGCRVVTSEPRLGAGEARSQAAMLLDRGTEGRLGGDARGRGGLQLRPHPCVFRPRDVDCQHVGEPGQRRLVLGKDALRSLQFGTRRGRGLLGLPVRRLRRLQCGPCDCDRRRLRHLRHQRDMLKADGTGLALRQPGPQVGGFMADAGLPVLVLGRGERRCRVADGRILSREQRALPVHLRTARRNARVDGGAGFGATQPLRRRLLAASDLGVAGPGHCIRRLGLRARAAHGGNAPLEVVAFLARRGDAALRPGQGLARLSEPCAGRLQAGKRLVPAGLGEGLLKPLLRLPVGGLRRFEMRSGRRISAVTLRLSRRKREPMCVHHAKLPRRVVDGAEIDIDGRAPLRNLRKDREACASTHLRRRQRLPSRLGRLHCCHCRADRVLRRIRKLSLDQTKGGRDVARDPVGLVPRALRRAFVAPEIEQADEDFAALFGFAAQELGELALRQEDRPGEAVEVEPDDLLDPGVDRAHAIVVDRRWPVLAFAALEGGLLRPPLREATGHPVGVAVGSELERDLGHRRPVGDEGRGARGHARDGAVEREHQRVENGRLAGAGRPGDDEQVEFREVDLLLRPEGGQPLDLEPERPHLSLSSASSSSKRSSIASSAAAPWRSA